VCRIVSPWLPSFMNPNFLRSRKTPTRVHAVLYTTIVIMFLISVAHTVLVATRYMLPSTFGHDIRSQQIITALAIIQVCLLHGVFSCNMDLTTR